MLIKNHIQIFKWKIHDFIFSICLTCQNRTSRSLGSPESDDLKYYNILHVYLTWWPHYSRTGNPSNTNSNHRERSKKTIWQDLNVVILFFSRVWCQQEILLSTSIETFITSNDVQHRDMRYITCATKHSSIRMSIQTPSYSLLLLGNWLIILLSTSRFFVRPPSPPSPPTW